MTPKTKRAIDSTFFHHGRFLAVQNHVRSLACSSAVPLRRFTRDGGQQDVIFAYIPPPPAKNFAAAQLMDGGGVLEAMHDVRISTIDVSVAPPMPSDASRLHVAGLPGLCGRLSVENKRRIAAIALQ